MRVILPILAVGLIAGMSQAVQWVRPTGQAKALAWGVKGRMQFAIPPAPVGPRGLIRLFYPTLPGGRYDLINFIAVEPIVAGVRGYSELEFSRSDGVEGKRIWTDSPEGVVAKLPSGAEQLTVQLHVEAFENGAVVDLTASIRSDRPDELRLKVHSGPGGKPMEFCILTATMGNRARARTLWLADGTESSRRLWPRFEGTGFAAPTAFPSSRMLRTPTGDLIAAITNDEADPSKAVLEPGSEGWAYMGYPVTQYWLMPGAQEPFEVIANARATYWGNHRPIPRGLAFENFELRHKFAEGREFVFGITRLTPRELGFRSSPR